MFTRFSTPHRVTRVSLGGASASVTLHAVLIAIAVGGVAHDGISASRGTGTDASGDGDGGGERLHWVGMPPSDRAAPTKPGAAPPIAYVVPGRGGPARAAHAGQSTAAGRPRASAAPVPGATPRRKQRAGLLPVALLSIPSLDSAMLVAGVVSSAPDLAHHVTRASDFVHRPLLEPGGAGRNRAITGNAPALTALGRVDEVPIALVNNPLPLYPPSLLHASVGGRVVVEFRIDSTGAVELGTFAVLESTNALFVQAVRSVLPRLRFAPAQLGAHTVAVRVRQPFVFMVRAGA